MTPGCGTTHHPFANTRIIFQLLEILPGKTNVTAGLAVVPRGVKGERSTVTVIPPGVCLREEKAHRSLPPMGQTSPNSSVKVPETSTCLWPQPPLTLSVAAFPLCLSVNCRSLRMSFNVSFFVLEPLPPLESVFAHTCLVVR